MDPLPLTTETRAPKLLDLMPLPHFLTQLGHYVLDHERFPGAWGEDVFPGLEDELGRGVAGVPLLQGAGQLAADGGVKGLQARLHEGQPRVDPGVDRHSVCQRVPVFHLQKVWDKTVPAAPCSPHASAQPNHYH